jgi:NADP-dependent 3-hydroxy acid dehydrogenase YdfG
MMGVALHNAADTIVCNAGIDIIKPAVDCEPPEWDHLLAVNLRGAFPPQRVCGRCRLARRQAELFLVSTTA